MSRELKESEVYIGFYEIPEYSKYLISKEGVVFNRVENQFLKGSCNPAGYYNFRLTDNYGNVLTWGRHRLMCYVFMYCENYRSLYANHINGIKGDDRLENLEWVTPQENVFHASSIGITEKCIPVSVRDVDSGKVTDFPSMLECAKSLGVTKDTIVWRTNIGERRVFPDRRQYRIKSDKPWFIPDSIEKELEKNGLAKKINVRNVLTGEVFVYNSIKELALQLSVSASTITKWLSMKDQPVLPFYLQIKYGIDETPWREVLDPEKELKDFYCKKMVKVHNEFTGITNVFDSLADCARALNMSITKLHYRLQSNGNKVFSDNCRYCYYVQ